MDALDVIMDVTDVLVKNVNHVMIKIRNQITTVNVFVNKDIMMMGKAIVFNVIVIAWSVIRVNV
jgi:hypothetical protein